MEIVKDTLHIISIVLIIAGLIFRKNNWGQKLLFFGLGMFAAFLFTDGLAGFIDSIFGVDN